jgi:hypothetical protein
VEALEARALLAVSPAPAAPELHYYTDSGVSMTDGVTNYNNSSTQRAPAFNVGRAPSQSVVNVYADGVEIGSRVAFSSGGYATVICRGDLPLADGVHVITARQTLLGQELSPESPPLYITIDATPPAPPAAPDLAPGSDTGESDADDVTADNSPTFELSAAEAGRFYLEFDGARTVSTDVAAGPAALTIGDALPAFTVPRTFDAFGFLNRSIAADVNNDRAPDFISSTTNGRVTIVLGNGDETFRSPPVLLFPTPSYPGQPMFLSDVVAADFDEDGNVDVVPIGAARSVFFGRGDGTFREQRFEQGFGGFSPAGADFNNDGHIDVLAGIGVSLGRGDGTFEPPKRLAETLLPTYKWVTDDFNRDGRVDLAAVSVGTDGSSRVLLTYLGNGDGTFQRPLYSPPPLGPLAEHMASGDFNADGFPDLVITSTNYGDGQQFLNEAAVFLGRGDGTFDRAPSVPTALFAPGVVTGDFNGDGRADWVASASERNGLTVALGNGDGTFRTTFLPTGSTSFTIVAADFDRDGRTDLATSADGFNAKVLLARHGPLADGVHSVRARLEDLAGNLSEAGAERSITIDSAAQLVAEIQPVEPELHFGPVSDVRITFNRPVTGLDLSDLALTRNGGPENLLSAAQTLSSADGGRVWTLANLGGVTSRTGAYVLTLAAGPETGVADDLGHTVPNPVSMQWRGATARVVGRHLFYNESAFDGFRATATAADLAAVAPDKRPLRAGETPGAANVSNYLKGINGIVVEFDGTPGAITADDFQFDVGGAPGGWRRAPAPQAVVRLAAAAGDAGADVRYLITWPNGAVRNTWLRVTVKPGDRTGLVDPDVFAFGNLVGDTGGRAGRVDALDVAAVRRGLTSLAGVSDPLDVNRDAQVNGLDVMAVRRGIGKTIPMAPMPAFAAAAAPPLAPLRDDELNAVLETLV